VLADWRPRASHSTGKPNGLPCKVGIAATDIAMGLYAHSAIMAALLSQQQTGCGVWIDCNLFESQVRRRARVRLFPWVWADAGAAGGPREHCVELPHRGAGGGAAWHGAPVHRAVSGVPVQGWVPHGQRRE